MKNKLNKFLAVWIFIVMFATGFLVVMDFVGENGMRNNKQKGVWKRWQ